MNHKCKMCGGALSITGKERIVTCEYCGTPQTVPCPDSERIAGLYEKADTYRRNLEFDKALVLYEEILNEDAEDAECYWLALLCEFGIEYVEESDGKRIPTINRMQPLSVYDNTNYKAALQYATQEQAEIYKAEAEEINRIQREALAISAQEEPYDIFICYKESDEQGRRTTDSILATDIYEFLFKEGYKVFFSRMTLDDKFGVAYEPYIYAALKSSKIMIAVGTKPEHYNAVWVRNEWSRYLALIKNGANKVLIPAYKDMEPCHLPEEFQHLQAINLGELGYQQDMLRGIRRIHAELIAVEEQSVGGNLRAHMYEAMEKKDWESTVNYANAMLKLKSEDMEAKICKRLAIMGIFEGKDMVEWGLSAIEENLLEKVQSSDKFDLELMEKRLSKVLPNLIESEYSDAMRAYKKISAKNDYKNCQALFRKLHGYKGSKNYYEEVSYKLAQIQKEEYDKYSKLAESDNPEELKSAIAFFEEEAGYLDVNRLAEECRIRLQETEKRLAKEKQRGENRTMVIMVAVYFVVVVIIFMIIKLLGNSW